MSAPVLAVNDIAYANACLQSGWISSGGEYVERFERAWADYCGVKHAIAVSSGTTGLQVAVDALSIGAGDEVIMPSFTIISCALAVIRAGATPVLVDCDPETFCIDVEQVASAVTSRTRAIMVVHMYGHPAEMDAISELAERQGLAIIEDAAEAHGSEYHSARESERRWRRCGSLGTVSVFSFYANKLITTGEGGMVLTDSDSVAERCRSLRNLCFEKERRFRHSELGYNYRLTNIQAAVGLGQVERMAEILARKIDIGKHYDALLGEIGTLSLPAQRSYARINYWVYPVVLDDDVSMDAELFGAKLANAGVETRPFFLGMHEQPALRALGLFDGVRFPITERLSRRGLYLPSGLGLTAAQVESVATAVKELLA